MDENRISKKEIIKAIEESGYLIEQRVEPIITSFSYYVDSNDAYVDDETGKTREIDLTGITGLVIKGDHFLYPFLIVECENNKQPVVFFRNEAPIKFLHHLEIKLSGIPIHFYDPLGESIRLTDFLNFEKFHHYCSGIFSTQYCSFQLTEKRGIKKWISLHPENQHDTFQSLIKCLEYKINEHFSDYDLPDKGEKESANIQIYYPLLVLQGDLYEAYLENGVVKIEVRNHIQYRKQVAKSNNRETYQIDVITENYLPEYMKMLEAENQQILKRLKRRIRNVEDSIDIIVEILRKTKKPYKYRDILDF